MKTLEQLDQNPGTVSLSEAFSGGWKLISPYLTYYILGGIVALLISFASSFVPLAGNLVNGLILTPCLAGGAVYVSWQIARGRGWTDFADMFKGFNFLAPLAISTLIKYAIILAAGSLFLIGNLSEIIEIIKLSDGTGMLSNKEELNEIFTGLFVGKNILLILIFVLIMLVLSFIWVFTPHFIVVYQLPAWQAMEASRKLVSRNTASLLGLFILLVILMILSALPCGLGLFFTYPWAIGSTYYAFNQYTQSHLAGAEEAVQQQIPDRYSTPESSQHQDTDSLI